jgi:phosphoenolpyruvate synthase/pyruvate phosphate dikinase
VNDDWRIRIDLEDEHADRLLERLGLDLGSEARELAKELEGRRLAVSRDDETLFVYAGSRAEAERAREIIEAELREDGIESHVGQIEHWLAGEDRWDDEPPERYQPEREVLEHGLAPWEVRVEAASPEEAERLAKQLQAEGLGVIRRHRYVIVGATSEDQAQELAKRLHGVPEASGQLIYEALPDNPFAIFGALGGNTTPI